MKIKKSDKFEEAYVIEGMEGHYYLDNHTHDILRNIVRVKRNIFSGKWYEDEVQFYQDKFKELMQSK